MQHWQMQTTDLKLINSLLFNNVLNLTLKVWGVYNEYLKKLTYDKILLHKLVH